jgi:hypothetical protein
LKKCICTFLFFFGVINIFSQSIGNIPLHFKSKFERYWGVGDVWGVQIGGTNYALITLACPPLEEWRIEHCEYK